MSRSAVGDRIGDDARMHDPLGVGRIVRQGPADDDDGPPGRAPLPAPIEHLLGAGQRSEPGLDAAEHDDGGAGAAAALEWIGLDPAAADRNGLRGHPAMLPDSPASIARYHRSMAEISREDVLHVAHLARLHLSDEEVDRMQAQLSNILEAIETLRDVDTSHVGPTASVIQLENVMREDVARPGLTREAALANAPLRDDPFLRVPTVLEEGR